MQEEEKASLMFLLSTQSADQEPLLLCDALEAARLILALVPAESHTEARRATLGQPRRFIASL